MKGFSLIPILLQGSLVIFWYGQLLSYLVSYSSNDHGHPCNHSNWHHRNLTLNRDSIIRGRELVCHLGFLISFDTLVWILKSTQCLWTDCCWNWDVALDRIIWETLICRLLPTSHEMVKRSWHYLTSLLSHYSKTSVSTSLEVLWRGESCYMKTSQVRSYYIRHKTLFVW